MTVQFLKEGDTAMVVQFGDVIDRALSDRVLRLSRRIRALGILGVTDLVPTFRSLLVHYDPLIVGGDELKGRLEGLLESSDAQRQEARQWTIPVCYEGGYAPDVDDVAQASGLSAAQVVEQHAETLFHVYMLGFVPGYPYMGDLPPALVLPRRSNPRTRVPPGSVAIASVMTAIYPLESPGGWHLIGATPIRLFDVDAEDPALLRPGDKVRFQPIGSAEYAGIRKAVQAGDFEMVCERAAS
ncbi:5-oxoprolinase subunit PxpB [Pusillimonas sp.]|uniref:5-oxoprolinase subunit PxpB n=1 Tax=Pusillimonas sp. TaxID=3040095 RepID=UPI0029A5F367|nr:5-oxoprolinase subunit PxpB [Pusillimonas sp.]MDX3894886.1 5-oxoprolinase subunit PxpB [Pusillimonas sp.]